MRVNLNTLLIVLAGLGVFAPDIATVATWLASMHIAWLGTVVKGLGLLAAFFAAAPLVVPRLRAFLALLGLATPPGAVAPWDPKRDAGPGPGGVPLVSLPGPATPPAGTPRRGPYGPGPGTVAVLVLAGSLLWGSAARAQTVQAIGCVDAANTWCVVPAAAAGWQINLKTGSVANGVGLAGLTLQHEFGSLPLGLGVYGGLGASANNQASYQGCVGASVTNFGLLCVGAQHASFGDGSTAWQGMLTVAGQLTFGGTPAYMRKAEARAAASAEGK